MRFVCLAFLTAKPALRILRGAINDLSQNNILLSLPISGRVAGALPALIGMPTAALFAC